jgi:hypothetical protein
MRTFYIAVHRFLFSKDLVKVGNILILIVNTAGKATG